MIAVVPAYNEEETVGLVASALISAGVFSRVIVVDDGSSDATAEEARATGADVLTLSSNRGKAGAMLAGLDDGSDVAFFDADAIGLESHHVKIMADHFALGFDQVCGIHDYGMISPICAAAFPLVTGQRFVKRWVIEALPDTCSGYSVETAFNYIVDSRSGSTCIVFLRGLSYRSKGDKIGVWRGAIADVRMFREAAAARRALEQTGGASCAIEEP